MDEAIYMLFQQKLNDECTDLRLSLRYRYVDLIQFIILSVKFKLQQASHMQQRVIVKHMNTFNNRRVQFTDLRSRCEGLASSIGRLIFSLAEAGCYEAGCAIADTLFKGLRIT